MIDFIESPHFGSLCIIIIIVLGIGYVLLEIFNAIIMDEFDPVCEAKCKKCINYKCCRRHGCDYECQDYMTEEMLQKKCITKHEAKR